jgi:hypothetical protein
MKLFSFKPKTDKMLIDDHVDTLIENLKDAATENVIYFYTKFSDKITQKLLERKLQAINDIELINETISN